AQVHHCIRTHSRPTDELEAAGLSSLENALFHPRMRSWWRAKAFVLIKAAEPSASSFPRNERNRATGTATDVDPPQQESPPRDQTTTVQRAESAPGSGPAEDSRGIGHSGLSTGGGPTFLPEFDGISRKDVKDGVTSAQMTPSSGIHFAEIR
ncbi:uncharacterized protein CCOS01_05997, partial [Colletotrichum costaricense]